ncbi:hypothetical protein EJ377_18340 [Chryseobacterium arthrosphaerae]|uniref:Uncharacterized protein n=1 Tax=Chryseobacterium arthrosphaerae TaxID=651561 RepID=A0A3S0QFL8_9FLAO|nr:hypothetical protein EJ377_18340 [Chryseobacterium arthrosphaerae]
MLPSEWNNIARQAEALDLSKISDLQSPTTGRFSDQALSSTFIITSEVQPTLLRLLMPPSSKRTGSIVQRYRWI